MTDVHAIIERCTRDGHTCWQHVAGQMGRSVDSVRAQFDQTYMRAHIWAPSREPQPEMEPNLADLSSPHIKQRVRDRILIILGACTASAQTIAAMTNATLGSAKANLSYMKRDGLVASTHRQPYTWSLTVEGKLLLGRLNTSVADEDRRGLPWRVTRTPA